MGWIVALVTIPALVMLGIMLWRPEGDKGWRDQAEGLRERLEREGFRASDTGIAPPWKPPPSGDQPGVRLRKKLGHRQIRASMRC